MRIRLALLGAIALLAGCNDPALLADATALLEDAPSPRPSVRPTEAPTPATASPAPTPTPIVTPDATGLPEFDVTFVVATGKKEALERASLEQLHREIDILNTYFVTDDRRPLIHFKFKKAIMHEDLLASDCGFADLLDQPSTWQDPFRKKFLACPDPKAGLDPIAITFIVADHWSKKDGFTFMDSLGGRYGAGRFGSVPFVQLDWKRLDHRIQSPEEHEMGHAFGLPHVCEPGATGQTDTNIMASHAGCDGSGGKRTRGFNAEQVATIKARIDSYKALFARNAGLLANP